VRVRPAGRAGARPSRPRYVPTDAEFVRADMRDAAALRQALRGVDAIVHHAAEVGVGQSMYQITRYVDGNTSGTGVMLELLANERHSVQRIVVASSMSVYGEGAYGCEDQGLVHPHVRDDAQLGRRDWEMRCPTCGAHAIRWRRSSRRRSRPRPSTRSPSSTRSSCASPSARHTTSASSPCATSTPTGRGRRLEPLHRRGRDHPCR